ncbi:MAG: M50 family metallopeptidase [Pseudomonadota bacterium]
MTERAGKNGLLWLIIAAIITVILWRVPGGGYILYPFTILATWFHEMGHGLTALMLGGEFRSLTLYPDGSGVATHSGNLAFGNLGRALVAAGGPMGPAVSGAVFIITGRYPQGSRYCLILLGGVLIASAFIWIDSQFGLIFTLLLGITILAASQTSPWLRSFAIQFLGVQAIISSYRQIDYLFTHSAVIGGNQMLSDTAHIGEALFMPYWFWGGAITLISLLLLVISLRIAYR